MRIVTDIQQIPEIAGGVVSIGNFDGVHRGHQAMLATLVRMARELQVPAVAMTFDPPPVALIAPGAVPPRLNTVQRKAELMQQLGIDALLVYPTTREFLSLTAAEFFTQIVLRQLAARGLVEGENFCFGKNRAGTSRELQTYCEQQGLRLEILSAVTWQGETISSTRIRQLITAGELDRAVDFLGHPYRLTGTVISGARRGRDLGFPTANLEEIPTLVPAAGVYAGICYREGQAIPAAVHVGTNPTFKEAQQKIEVHLIDHQADLYGQTLSVDLLARCRDVRPFPDSQTLQQQLRQDIDHIRTLIHSKLSATSRH